MADLALKAAQVLEDAKDGSDVKARALGLINEDLPLFLHTVVAADGLANPQIVNLLRDLHINPEALATYLGPTGLLSDTSLVDVSVLKRQTQTMNAQTTKILTYDLARECTDGYARLALLPVSKYDGLIGTYRLEPFKVLAFLVQRLGHVPQDRTRNQASLITAIRSQGWTSEAITSILEQQFQSKNEEVSERAAIAAGRLVGHGLVEFNDIFAGLDPGDEFLQSLAEKPKQQAAPSMANALLMAAPLPDSDEEDEFDEDMGSPGSEDGDLSDDSQEDSEEKMQEDDKDSSEAPQEAPTPSEKSVAPSIEGTPVPNDATERKTGQDLFDILVKFLYHVAVVNPEPLLPLLLRYPHLGKLELIHAGINQGVAGFLRELTESTEEQLWAEADENDPTKLVSVTSWAQLEVLGPVWLRLCEPFEESLTRALADGIQGILKKPQTSQPETFLVQLEAFVKRYMIHALFGPPEVRKFARSIWGPADRFSYSDEERTRMIFSVMTYWYYDVCKNDPRAREESEATEQETRGVLRRITDKLTPEIMKPLEELVQRDPMSALTVIIGQAENYDKVASLLPVMSKSNLPRVIETALPLVVLERLSLGRPGRIDDGLFPRKWLVLISRMLTELGTCTPPLRNGLLTYRIEPIIDFLLAQIHETRHDYLYMFHEFLVRIGSSIPSANMSIVQLEGVLCRGLTRVRALEMAGYAATPTGTTEALGRAVWPRATSWIIALGRLISQIELAATKSVVPSTAKQLAVHYDETSETLMLLIDFIDRLCETKDFSELQMPDINSLVTDFGVPLPFAFAVWRSQLSGATDKLDLSKVLGEFDVIDRDSYLTFWTLSGYDVIFDVDVYEAAVVSDKTGRKERSRESNNEDQDPPTKIQARQRLGHKLRYNTVSMQIKTSCKQWFEIGDFSSFVELCVLPRVVLSPLDALYTSRFIDLLYKCIFEKAESIADILFSQATVVTVLRSSTIDEVLSFGVFMLDMLKLRAKHRGQKSLETVHTALVRAVQQCIDGEDLLAVPAMNAIQLVSKILGEFPLLRSHGAAILSRVEPLTANTVQDDVRTAANSLITRLKLREPQWIDAIVETQVEAQPAVPTEPRKIPTGPAEPASPKETIEEAEPEEEEKEVEEEVVELPAKPAQQPQEDAEEGTKRPSEEHGGPNAKSIRPGYEDIFKEQSAHKPETRSRRRGRTYR